MTSPQAKCQTILLVILLALWTTFPLSTAETTPLRINDPEDDFTIVSGLRAKQPYLDIKNITVEYDRSTDTVRVTMGLYALLPQKGPTDPSDKVSDYFYTCNFQTGENATLDGASVILEKDENWTAALLSSHIGGNTLDGLASPVKYHTQGDTLTFVIPAHIATWGERPKRLLITTEAGYEGYQLPGGELDSVYYDRAPQEDALTFEIPPAPISYLPLLFLAAIIAPITFLIVRTLGRRTHSRRRRK